MSITVAGNPLLAPIVDFVAHSDNMLEVSISSRLEVMNLDPNITIDVLVEEITDMVYILNLTLVIDMLFVERNEGRDYFWGSYTRSLAFVPVQEGNVVSFQASLTGELEEAHSHLLGINSSILISEVGYIGRASMRFALGNSIDVNLDRRSANVYFSFSGGTGDGLLQFIIPDQYEFEEYSWTSHILTKTSFSAVRGSYTLSSDNVVEGVIYGEWRVPVPPPLWEIWPWGALLTSIVVAPVTLIIGWIGRAMYDDSKARKKKKVLESRDAA